MKELKFQRIRKVARLPDYMKVRESRIDYADYLASFPGPYLEMEKTRLRVHLPDGSCTQWVDLKGPRGDPGAPGQDGPVGPAGLRGPTGSTGPEGRRGARGLQGVPGIRGKDGKPGIRGDSGPAGVAGVRGERGLTGVNGRDGLQGPKGDTGPMPNHRWVGSRLQFQLPSGKWGKLVDLRGPTGPSGGGSAWVEMIAQEASVGVKYAKQLDKISETQTYFAEAEPGTLKSASLWRIQLITTQTDGDLSIEWADGVATFTKVWDDRATYSYT